MTVVAMPEEAKFAPAGDQIIVTGIGALNVIEAMRSVPRETPIFNVGYAGAKGIKIGTRCRVGLVTGWHPIADYVDRTYQLDGEIPCYTSDDFVLSADAIEPCLFDMELAYILALGFTNVTAEKIVSDNLSMTEYEHEKYNMEEKDN